MWILCVFDLVKCCKISPCQAIFSPLLMQPQGAEDTRKRSVGARVCVCVSLSLNMTYRQTQPHTALAQGRKRRHEGVKRRHGSADLTHQFSMHKFAHKSLLSKALVLVCDASDSQGSVHQVLCYYLDRDLPEDEVWCKRVTALTWLLVDRVWFS